MAKTLTIAGTDFLDQYKSSSAEINEKINNDPNSMEIQVVRKPVDNDDIPEEGSEIIYEIDSDRQFGGFVTKKEAEEYGDGRFFSYTIEATDWSYIFNQKTAMIAYEDTDLGTVAKDLLSRYIASSYGFSDSGIETGPSISSITFDHINIRECFEKLAKLTGYVWWVGYDKTVYFQAPDASQAPEKITDTSDNYSEVAIEYDTSQVRNSVIVIGNEDGVPSANPRIDTLSGDGDKQTFDLGEKIDSVDYIKLNGNRKNFSENVNEKESDYFVWNFEAEHIRDVSGNSALTASDTIEIKWTERIPVIVERSDGDSIDFFSNLDGGDGVYEHTIKERTITTKEEARARAEEELDEFADPLVLGEFRTNSTLKNTSNDVEPGQALTVKLPAWNINEETVYMIREVVKTIDEDGTNTFYNYEVRFGGRMVGLQEFLESLTRETEEVQSADEIKVIHRLRDTVNFEDANLTHTIENPPYVWGGDNTTPTGTWDLSEWA